jgi:rsbT antagonist protein RsbS
VFVLDSHLCAVIARLSAASRLMGARPVLSGMAPEMVMTLQAMGIELTGIKTVISVQDALTALGGEGVRAVAARVEVPGVERDEPELIDLRALARRI